MKKGQVIKFIDYSYKIQKVNKGIYKGISSFSKDWIIIELEGQEWKILKTQVIK